MKAAIGSVEPEAPLWRSHHFAAQHDRCASVGGRLVCRRCLVLYPVIAAVTALTIFAPVTHRFDRWICWVFLLPSLVEFSAEHLWGLAHRPRRLVALTVIAGIGAGRGLGRYLQRPGDVVFWAMVAEVVVVATVVFVAVGRRSLRGGL